MESLRELDELIDIEERLSGFSAEVFPFIYPNDGESSSTFVGSQLLPDGLNYVICMSDAIHLIQKFEIRESLPFTGANHTCYAYQYIENCILAPHPLHALILSDQTILILGVEKGHFKEFKRLSFTAQFRNVLCKFAVSQEYVLYSSDGELFESLGLRGSEGLNQANATQVYKFEMGSLLYFDLMNKGRVLICFYRHRSTGDLYVELANWCKNVYVPSGRHFLGHSIEFCIKKVDDSRLICLTSEKTWSFGLGSKPKFIINEHAERLEGLINLDIRCVGQDLILKAFCRSGTVWEAPFPSYHPSQVMEWCRLPKIRGLERYALEFASEIFDDVYLIASGFKGVSLVSAKDSKSWNIFPCQCKKMFDGCCLTNGGTDLDSMLFCGALTESDGFIEKRYFQYSSDLICIVSEKVLTSSPIEDLWVTKIGPVYLSEGNLYQAHTNEKLKSWNGGICLTRNLVEFPDVKGEVLSLRELSDSAKGHYFCYSVIYKGGDLKVLGCESQGDLQNLIVLKLGKNLIGVAQAAATFSTFDECYYISSYHQYGRLSFWRNETQVLEYDLGFDFSVSELLVKIIQSCCRTIVTSTNARAKIFGSTSNEALLEVVGTSNEPFKVCDLGKDQSFVLLYNENESFMINLISLDYGKFSTGVRPLKIIAERRNRDSLLYAIDEQGKLTTLCVLLKESSQVDLPTPKKTCDVVELPGTLPLCVTPLPALNYAIIVARNSKRKTLQVKLFDYEMMRIVHRYELNERISGALVQPFWDGNSDIFMRRFFLICCNSAEQSFFQIFRIDNLKIVPLQHCTLSMPVSSVQLARDHSKVVLGGAGLEIYDISKDYAKDEVLLRYASCASKNEFLHVADVYGLKTYKCIQPFGELVEDDGTEGKVGVAQSERERTMDGFTPTLIRKVVSKRLHRQSILSREGLAKEGALDHLRPSIGVELFGRFAKAGRRYKESVYVITLDTSDCMTMFYQPTEDEQQTAVCVFQVDEPVLNIVPAKGEFSSVQTGDPSLGPRLQGAAPLFMITCANNTVYTVVEFKNRLPFKEAQYKGKLKSFQRLSSI